MTNKMNHSKEELVDLLRKETCGRMKLKLLALLHFQEGKSRYQISAYLKVSRTSVNKWISSYLSLGLEGLKEKKHSGRPASLSNEQLSQLNSYMEINFVRNNGRLKAKQVQEYIESSFGVKYEISNIYKIMTKMGLPS